jgi:hypothetical protein
VDVAARMTSKGQITNDADAKRMLDWLDDHPPLAFMAPAPPMSVGLVTMAQSLTGAGPAPSGLQRSADRP